MSQIVGSVGGTGNVVGPGSSVDRDIAIFSGTTGKIIQDSGVNITSSQAIIAGVGSVANPTYSFTGDTGTGWYWIGAGHIGFASGGGVPVDISGSALVSNVETRTFGGLAAFGYVLNNTNTPAAATPFNVGNSDYFIGLTTSLAIQVNLPAAPASGRTLFIKDISGNAAVQNVTINGNGHNIDGAATYVINVDYGSVQLIWNGTTWSIV